MPNMLHTIDKGARIIFRHTYTTIQDKRKHDENNDEDERDGACVPPVYAEPSLQNPQVIRPCPGEYIPCHTSNLFQFLEHDFWPVRQSDTKLPHRENGCRFDIVWDAMTMNRIWNTVHDVGNYDSHQETSKLGTIIIKQKYNRNLDHINHSTYPIN